MAERIAVVTTSYPAGPGDAAGHFVAHEARLLARAGHHVTVLAPHAQGALDQEPWRVVRVPHLDALGWPGASARLRERPSRGVGLALFVALAARELSALRVDRVVAHWLLPGALPIALAAPRSARLEVVVHGSDLRLFARLPAAPKRALLGSLVRRAASFRCVSTELQRALAQMHPRIAALTRVEPCAIDVTGAPSRDDARRALGVAAGTSLIVIAARLVPSKRVQVALAATEGCGASLVVVGDGPERGALQRRFPQARFTGQLARGAALTWIAAADLLVTASREEGAPGVVREARALGVTVVTAPAGDVRLWAARDPGIVVVPELDRARVDEALRRRSVSAANLAG